MRTMCQLATEMYISISQPIRLLVQAILRLVDVDIVAKSFPSGELVCHDISY